MAAEDELAALGRTVRALRLARGLSVDELAAAAGMAPVVLAALERGQYDAVLDELRDLADALHIRISTLMREAERQDTSVQDAGVLFARRLRELRTERGISQDELARRTGVHSTAVGRLERGTRDPQLTTILRIARGLGVQPGMLLDNLAGGSPPRPLPADRPRGARES
jgi:transcriptional regulator with XRE-family HTH domain